MRTKKLMIPLIALLTAFPPLSTDMFLPALPHLQEIWQAPLVMVNLTLIVFFITYCASLLIYGPISDRFGRRRPLVIGLIVYITSSFVCALSVGVNMLIVARIFQAAGAASASASAIAICKDYFEAREREKVLAYVAVMMALAPMIAPIIGGWIMTFLAWPWTFVFLAIIAFITLIGVLKMPETLETRSELSVGKVFNAYGRLFRNGRFMSLNVAMAMTGLPLFAFIAGSPEIYISGFGLSETHFSYFFAFNAMGLLIGPLVFTRMAPRFSTGKLLTWSFGGLFVGGLGMLLGGHGTPWGLAIPMFVGTFFAGFGRPPSNNLVLEQVDQDIGAASSFIVFSVMLVGSLSMWIISFDWSDKIWTIGLLGTIAGGVPSLFWLLCKNHFFQKGGMKPQTEVVVQ